MGNTPIADMARASNIMIFDNLDRRDQEIMTLLLSGQSNKAIATRLKIPMSTVQRRTRRLFERGLVRLAYELNYKKLGLRKGLLHVYLKDGNIQGIAEQIARIYGIQSTSIHIGNSDIVGLFVFKETQQLLDIVSDCKKIPGVDRVVWSEEVLNVPANAESRRA